MSTFAACTIIAVDFFDVFACICYVYTSFLIVSYDNKIIKFQRRRRVNDSFFVNFTLILKIELLTGTNAGTELVKCESKCGEMKAKAKF